MKRLPLLIAVTMVLATAMLVSSVAAGNGIDINGKHYNLNLIGSKFVKNMPANIDSGHVIFVAMGNGERLQTRIYLTEGDYQVIDKDGSDGIAKFQLPQPYVGDADVENPSTCDSDYQVFVRVGGKPGGSGNITSGVCNATAQQTAPKEGYPICMQDGSGVWIHSGAIELSSHGNLGKFEQVTHQLTQVEIDGKHYGLFSDTAAEVYGDLLYFWELWNDNMKQIQLRFYETPDDYTNCG